MTEPTTSYPKLYIKTFGCQMNEYDSAKLAHLMQQEFNFVITDNHEIADLIIFNTCSVRKKAQEKFFSELGALHKLKLSNPNLVIAVGGCVAAQEKKNICRRAPDVGIVFGPQTWQRLPEMYRLFCTNGARIIDTEFCATEKFSCLNSLAAPTKAEIGTPHRNVFAYVTVMEGCNKFCTYCIVPHTRGREISRPFADVMREVHALTLQGVKEICFLGQNVNNYRDASHSLADLIESAAQIPALARLRFMTSHPAHFSDELIALYARIPKLAAHLHLPVQSGSNSILRAMHRSYTHEEYREIVRKLRCAQPNVSISSDFIVGFPGESDDDFAATMDLIDTVGFDTSFSFIYSPRPGTRAMQLEDNVPQAVKKQRLQIMQQALNKKATEISAAMLGSVQKIIVTGYSRKSSTQLSGRTENNRIVNFTASPDLLGKVVTVKITRALTNSLQGELSQ